MKKVVTQEPIILIYSLKALSFKKLYINDLKQYIMQERVY